MKRITAMGSVRAARPAFMLGVAVALLAGCAVGPNFKRPAPPKETRYTHKPVAAKTQSSPGHGGESQAFVKAGLPAHDWWRLFHSKKLNRLIEQGVGNSPQLQAAAARLRQAQANFEVVSGQLYPQIDGSLGVTRQKTSSASFGVSGFNQIFNTWRTQLSISYDLDPFGANRRAAERALAYRNAQFYQTKSTYLALVANVSTTAVNAAGTRARLQATQDIIDAERQAVNITRNQYQVGSAAYADVLRARSQLLGTLASLPSLRRQLVQYRHRLANLVGTTPASAKLPVIRIADLRLPRKLPVALPSSLVRHRPDILASEQSLHAATAQVGVRTAALFPDITLSASAGRSADAFPALYNMPSGIFSVAAQLLAPIFHGFSLHAQRRLAIASSEESFANYKQTVLSAFQEVADAMRSLEEDAKSLKAEYRYLQASKKSLQLDQTRFKAGAIGFLTVLTDERQLQQAQISYTQAQTTRYQDTVQFFQALKGGNGQLSNVPNVVAQPVTGTSTSTQQVGSATGSSMNTTSAITTSAGG